MAFKINLPTEKCRCDAKLFYDKYRKQVHNFIRNEIKIAVDNKTLSYDEELSDYEDFFSEKRSESSEKSFEGVLRLPKIKGAQEITKRESEIKSAPKITTKTHLPIIKGTKKWSDEFTTDFSDLTLLLDKHQQKDTKPPRKLRAKDSKDVLYSGTSDFITDLKSKSKIHGLDDEFITNMLNQAREAGHEEDLLFYLSNASDEGELQSLLLTMAKVVEEGKFNEFTADLINKIKEEKKENILLKLMNIFNSGEKDDDDMASLTAKALEEDPDNELLIILSKAIKENKLNSLLSSINQAEEQGQLDDMIDILMKKGKKEQAKQLVSKVNLIARDMGIDESFVDDLLSKAKELGQLDELLSEMTRAKSKGTLEKLISTFASTAVATKENEPETDIILEDFFDEAFLAKWFAQAKTPEEEQLLLEKLFKVVKSGKHIELNALVEGKQLESIDELFATFEEVISDEGSSDNEKTYAPVSKETKQKLVRPKQRQLRNVSVIKKRTTRVFDKQNLDEPGEDLPLLGRKEEEKHKIKKQMLFKRQFLDALPDVDYDLVERHRLASLHFVDSDESGEEEGVHEQKIDTRTSKRYTRSFLGKIYGGRPKQPVKSVVASKSKSVIKTIERRRVPPKKSRGIEKENQTPSRTRNIVKYIKKTPLVAGREYSDDSDISSYEELLDEKISRMCDISGEERSEQGYLVGFRYKDDDETFDWRKKSRKKTKTKLSLESTYYEEGISRARRRAMVYCSSRKIDELFHFLGSHLIAQKPKDPIKYLIMLLGECILFRNGIGRPPILFEQYHVESLYYSMDVFHEGFISVEQYRTGMETLFIKEFKDKPHTNKKDMVLKDTFIHEALKRQRIQLRSMLRGTSDVFFHKENSCTTLGSVWSKIDLYHEG